LCRHAEKVSTLRKSNGTRQGDQSEEKNLLVMAAMVQKRATAPWSDCEFLDNFCTVFVKQSKQSKDV